MRVFSSKSNRVFQGYLKEWSRVEWVFGGSGGLYVLFPA